jgi:hypothetical protein
MVTYDLDEKTFPSNMINQYEINKDLEEEEDI